jgi:hypothetical protein
LTGIAWGAPRLWPSGNRSEKIKRELNLFGAGAA